MLVPPAAKTLFEKRVLDSQKLLLQGACIVLCLVTLFPITHDALARRALEKIFWGVQGGLFYKKAPPGRRRQKLKR
jgi:hypothetical protein